MAPWHAVTSGCVVLTGTSAPELQDASPVAADLAELGPAAARQVLLQCAQETAPEWQPNSALKCAAWTLLANFGPGGVHCPFCAMTDQARAYTHSRLSEAGLAGRSTRHFEALCALEGISSKAYSASCYCHTGVQPCLLKVTTLPACRYAQAARAGTGGGHRSFADCSCQRGGMLPKCRALALVA